MTKIEMEAMEAVIGMRKEMAKANEIDWEQRRYCNYTVVLPERIRLSKQERQ